MMSQVVEPINDQPTLPMVSGMPGPSRQLKVDAYGLTDAGQVRPKNEDQFLIAELIKALTVLRSSMPQPKTQYSHDSGHLFIVADGMGGHRGGEQASALVVDSIEDFVLHTLKWFFQLHSDEERNILNEFQTALRQADAKIMHEAAQHPELRGMGTTLTMAYSCESQLFVIHVGDSRCYLQRAGRLYRLTQDHTLVEELVRNHALTPEQAKKHYLRHVITNCVGGDTPGLKVEVHRLELSAGDTVILCSDGLTEMVTDDRIAAILNENADARRACEKLVKEANANGGKDNITVIVSRFG